MLALDDPKWKQLHGGYRIPYDASDAFRRLEQGGDVWNEVWENLHHQGDVGEASYAAVPHLVRITSKSPQRDWNPFSLISTIEIERHRKSNPPLPGWLVDDYKIAWSDLLHVAINGLRKANDPLAIRPILGAIALAKGELKLGAMISFLDESELDEHLEQFFVWSEFYRE